CVLVVAVGFFVHQEHRHAQRMNDIPKRSDQDTERETVNDSAAAAVTNAWMATQEIHRQPAPVAPVPVSAADDWKPPLTEEECCPDDTESGPFPAGDSAAAAQSKLKSERRKATEEEIRAHYIKKYGDTPLIRRFLAARVKFYRKEPLDADEALAMFEAFALFRPTEANLRNVEALKRDLAQMDPADFKLVPEDGRNSP
ncbi:MAG: hypothetical protein OXT74_00055, partial [Candidatus Poribacteria bacterium]|nr:hypothetical protein [Candidatus Poribacteria bacterium]